MTWDVGAYEYQGVVPPIPTPPIGVKILVVGKEKNVKVTKRKTNSSTQVLITVNKDTTVVVE